MDKRPIVTGTGDASVLPEKTMPVHEYLGDGAYVTWTGYSYQVKANDHINPTDVVHLGPREMESLIQFVKRIRSN